MRERLVAFGIDRVCMSIITSAEIRFGFARKSSPRLEQSMRLLFDIVEVVPFEAPADLRYGRIRAALERAGTPISGNDLLIAAHALTLDLILVTANTREFSRVPDLRLENWLD